MGQTAENLAEKYSISRTEADAFALQSQQRWKNAQDNGYFKAEIAPVTVKVKRQEVEVSIDEHPRPQSTPEALAKLPAVFKKNGAVTAANASVNKFSLYVHCTHLILVTFRTYFLLLTGD